MTFVEHDHPPYIFHVRSPLYIKAFALPLIGIVVGPIAFIYCKLGIAGAEALFRREIGNPLFWLLDVSTMVGSLAFAFWILRPPQSTLARFEFTPERIRFVPNFVGRFMGEASEEAAISTASSEVLLCYRVWPKEQPGYRIIVRTASGNERELASHSAHTHVNLNAAEVARIAVAISPATGLPARVVVRRKSLNETVEEVTGNPPPSKINRRMGFSVAVAAVPYAGGIMMGWLSPSPPIVIAGGLALWLCMMLSVYVAARTESTPKEFPALRTLTALTTLVTFSAVYGLCFVVTAYLHGRQ